MKNTARKIIASALAAATILGTGMTAGFTGFSKASPLTVNASAASTLVYAPLTATTAKVTGCNGNPSSVTIPEKTPDGLRITEIGEGAFENKDSITSVNLGKVEIIDGHAFRNCDRIQSITIPESVKEIDIGAFADMKGLEKLSVNGKIEKMGASAYVGAFQKCESLKEVTFKEGAADAGWATFKDCISLKTVKLPSTITSIHDKIFENCKSLETIKIPDSVTEIGKSAFSGCTSLKNIIIPDKVKTIGDYAFLGCESATSIKLGKSVVSIGDKAFESCNGVEKLAVPESVEIISMGAFSDMKNLKKVTVKGKITKMGASSYKGIFSNCEKLETVIFNEGTTVLSRRTFAGCSNLKKVHLPASLKKAYIDETAFDDANADVIICSSSESNGAIAFAKEHKIKWTVCKAHADGDIDGNGNVNSTDALAVLQHSVGQKPLKDSRFIKGDVNEDGVVNSADALLILQYSVGQIDCF